MKAHWFTIIKKTARNKQKSENEGASVAAPPLLLSKVTVEVLSISLEVICPIDYNKRKNSNSIRR